MAYQPIKSYNVSVATSDIPNAWVSSNEPRVHSGGSRRIVSIASQNGDVSAGQQLSFVLPSNMGSGFMVSGSAYIKMTVSITQPTAYKWQFRQYGSASSCFLRMSALLSGTLAEQIQNYNKLYNSLLLHASNGNFLNNDSYVEENTFPGAFQATQELSVCVPVGLGLFNAKQHLPLFLLSSCQLQVDLDSTLNAITQGSGDDITNYTIKNANLVFEQLVPDSQFEQGVKQMLASRVYQIPINTWYNLKVAQATAITQNIGLNSSSVRAILWNNVTREGKRDAGHFTNAGLTSAFLYLDGQLVSNSNLASIPEQFLEMNRALGLMYDVERTSVGVKEDTAGDAKEEDFTLDRLTRGDLASGTSLCGLSCSRSSEAGFSFQGTPVNSAVLQATFSGSNGSTFIYCALQQVVTIDMMGSVNLIR